MIKRLLDILVSLTALILLSPILLLLVVLIFFQDFKSPFYIAPRVGKNNIIFQMVKLRTMVVNADKSGVDSTSSNDPRITSLGSFVRRYKFDELTQLINVLKGEMSLVGPRPNVINETKLYSSEEEKLLTYKPGITDFASIVFSDEGEILRDSKDPDIDYNQLIRPGKNYLGLFYIENSSFLLDIKLCLVTVVAILSRSKALNLINKILINLDAREDLIALALRDKPLKPMPPPRLSNVIVTR